MTLPTLFVSHGSPMIAIEDSPARRFLLGLGNALPRPKAIVVASAHWESPGALAVSVARQPRTIHDFGGFPAELYDLRYPAPGAPEVAARVARLLEQEGFAVERDETRGLDHGAWVPLQLMYPDAGVPVAQLSLRHGAPPSEHARIGAALRPLRDEGVLVVGSGSLTHNLYALRGARVDAQAPSWVSEFADWTFARLRSRDREALLDYRARAPYAVRNHPSEEHLLPLFVALGAAGEGAFAERLHASYEYGALAMDAYSFA